MDQGPVRGDRLGRFELGVELGAGGMGTVFRATDVDLRREVAVKVLRPEVTGPETRVRMTREAQAMARLAHPNVVRVHELGDDHAGVYLVMELVEGQSLTAWLAERTRSQAEVVEVFLAAADGLIAAHDQGLVHRDFKPENVLVDRRDRVRVTDFGLVCVSGERVAAERDVELDLLSLALTQTGAVVGTPRYMAPEQFLGRPVDARTDQFAFCVALYRALYGEAPFAGTRYGELMDEVIAGRVRAAPTTSSVATEVRAVIVRGLAADPAARFDDMKALVRALRAAHDRRPRWRRGGAIAAATVVAVALAGVAVVGGDSPRPAATAACAVCARLVEVDSGIVLSERALDVVAGPDGQLAWTEARGDQRVIVVAGSGGRRDLLAAELVPSQPAFAPDGYRLAFASAKRGVFMMQSPSATAERLTDGDDRDPAWLDGDHLVFTRHEGASAHAMVARLASAEPPTRLLESPRRVLGAGGGRVLLERAGRLYVWHDHREEEVAIAPGWRRARLTVDGRDVVVTTEHDVIRAPRDAVHHREGSLRDAVITSDGRVVVAER